MQYVFPHPGPRVKSSSNEIYPKLDIKGDRSISVLPPTKDREWIVHLPEDLSSLPGIPSWLLRALAEAETRRKASRDLDSGDPIPEGQRNSTLTSIGGRLVNAGLSSREIFAALMQINDDRCTPALDRDEVEQIARSVSRYEPKSQNPGFPSKDFGIPVGNQNPKNNLRAKSFNIGGRPAPRQWVIDNILPERFPTTLYGDGGKAKTFLAIHLALSVADPATDHWLGYKTETAPVVYMDWELDETEVRKRAYDIAAGMGLDTPPEDFLYLECVEAGVEDAFRAAYDTCVETGAKVVVIDSMGMAMEGDSEASSDILGFYRKYINPLRSLGLSILVVDHQAKMVKGERYGDKDIFGSVYKKNSQRSVFQINGEWSGNVLYAKLTHKKANLGPQQDDIPATLTFEQDKVTVRREDSVVFEASTHDRILDALRNNGPSTNAELAAALDMKRKDVSNRTGELKDTGKIVETGERRDRQKVWNIPDQNPKALTRESGNSGIPPEDQFFSDTAA